MLSAVVIYGEFGQYEIEPIYTSIWTTNGYLSLLKTPNSMFLTLVKTQIEAESPIEVNDDKT